MQQAMGCKKQNQESSQRWRTDSCHCWSHSHYFSTFRMLLDTSLKHISSKSWESTWFSIQKEQNQTWIGRLGNTQTAPAISSSLPTWFPGEQSHAYQDQQNCAICASEYNSWNMPRHTWWSKKINLNTHTAPFNCTNFSGNNIEPASQGVRWQRKILKQLSSAENFDEPEGYLNIA